MIEFRILGSVGASRAGQALAIGGRRQQALLALLLLEPGQVVSTDRLVDELWAGEPPEGGAATIRSYVSRLRTVLGDDAPIVGRGAGYAIDVAADQLDARRFAHLVQEGQAALARNASRRAADRLRAALELWHGRALAGVADDGSLRAAAERLEELRLLALEDRIDAELRLGDSAVLVDEIEALVDEHPYRERLWRHLMLALYRAERQADALAAYQRARTRLRDDLGLDPGDELRELEGAILRHDVPRVDAPDERHNLPVAMTSFVGREDDLAAVERLLADSRLVTLTGIGGVGKTRIAIEASSRSARQWTDGAWFVDLSALLDPDAVPREVAGVLGVVEQSDLPFVDRLSARLRDAELLIVLDNCEHLRAACAELAQRVLGSCPRVRILATSREPLGVAGEVDLAVQPLGTPGVHDGPTTIVASEAVRLFLARAREARPAFTEDEATLTAVGAICRDLDGLPLAIELAAARVKALSVQQVAQRIADRFRFLVSWRRLSTDRHRTLLEVMDWSYELLAEPERTLLDGLSVFAGGFNLDGAAAVCLDGDDDAALALVGRLVDASLAVAEQRAGEMRYRLLETVREYAAGHLGAADTADALRRRHAEWCLDLAERAEPQLTGDRQVAAFATLETEHDNLRAALAYLGTTADVELRLRLTTALTRFWYVRGYLSESRRWLERALADADAAPPLLRRRALTAAAAVALIQGDYGAAISLSEQGLAAARASGEARLVANGLSNLGAIALAAGDRGRAAELLAEAVTLARQVGDARVAAMAINNLGDLALTERDYDRAGELFEESLGLLQAQGDTANVARSLFNLGAVALMHDRLDEAATRFRDSVRLGRDTGDKEDLAWCLLGIAGYAAASGLGPEAAVLLGAADGLLEAMGAAFKPFERRLHDDTLDRARAMTSGDAFGSDRDRGAALSLDDAIDEALRTLAAGTGPVGAGSSERRGRAQPG